MAWELWTTERDKEVLVENGEPGLWGSLAVRDRDVCLTAFDTGQHIPES